MDFSRETIAVIGLGYVGLPLAAAFGRIRPTLGFDVNPARIAELRAGRDSTREVDAAELADAHFLTFVDEADELARCGVFIVAVPTPVDSANRPDLAMVAGACQTVARAMRKGALVIFESTVYPGCTRDYCAPILARDSGLVFNRDFFVGYSPERINPGDKTRRLAGIVKVTSGSTPEAAVAVDALYSAVVAAGTHCAPTIEVAEAAKVIENTQRDLNIALMNELAIIFHRLGIDTCDVLAAASTKWNFLPFSPGLVGGHCIGVDPYYLTHRAQEIGYHPEVILAGRRVNDGMGAYVAQRLLRLMMQRGSPVVGGRILVLGLTFKENCPDLRNSKIVDLIDELKDCRALVDVHDPLADACAAQREYGLSPLDAFPQEDIYDAIVIAVAHEFYARLGAARIRACGKPGALLFDVKGLFGKDESDGRL